MNIGILNWQDNTSSVILFDVAKKRIIKKHIIEQDAFIESVLFLRANKKHLHRLLVISGVTRFSLSRQATLLVNIVAYEQRISVGVLHKKSKIIDDTSLASRVVQEYKKIKWHKVITPTYSQEPNITVRKKRT